MSTLTIEIPDDLAAQLDPLAVPLLLRELVIQKSEKMISGNESSQDTAPIYREITQFLASGPTREQILAFKIRQAAQERLEMLLETNREASLSPQEQAELETYLQLSEWVSILKASARSGKELMR